MESTYDQLIDMGFKEAQVIKAIQSTQDGGLEVAIEWLTTHDTDEIDASSTTVGGCDNPIEDENTKGDKCLTVAQSMKCEDCGRFFATDNEVQMHASRTGHVNFSESTEEIKPLTDEEKRSQLERLQEKMKQKRLEREAQEEKDNLEREKHRRKQGKTIIDAKTKFEESEMKRLAELKRREKEEDRLYREKLKTQIASDREARKQCQISEPTKSTETVAKVCIATSSTPDKYDTCRIQIRHPNGAPFVYTFSANDSLFKVAALFAEKTATYDVNSIEFKTTMPVKLYGSEYMGKTVKELGFCPSIVLMAVVKK